MTSLLGPAKTPWYFLIAAGLVMVIALPVSYTHLRAHETVLDLVCRLLLEKKNTKNRQTCFDLLY